MKEVTYKNRNIQFREPQNIQELEMIFKLRQIVYSEDPLLHKMVNIASTFDINHFDLKALHFAAFDGENPIAYIRMTTETSTHFTNWVQKILFDHNITPKDTCLQFPFQMYYPDLDWGLSFITNLKGNKIGEVGKLEIHKDFRQGGIILDHLIQTFIDYCKKEQNFNTGFGLCTPLLERYYLKFGFSRVKDAVPFIHEELPEAVVVRFDHCTN